MVHGRAGHAGHATITIESLGHGDTDTELLARRTTEQRRVWRKTDRHVFDLT
jgi:hypothetical protein